MMSADTLVEKIKSNLKACGYEIIAQNECLFNSIAKAVVDEIQQNAEAVLIINDENINVVENLVKEIQNGEEISLPCEYKGKVQ